MPATVDLNVYRGDSWSQTFRLLDSSAVPIDLTGATAACWARDGNAAVVNLVATIPGAASPGVVTVTPPGGGVPAGDYRYDLEITKTGVVTTWIKGRLRVEQDITNAA